MKVWRVLLVAGFLQLAQLCYADENQSGANPPAKEESVQEGKAQANPEHQTHEAKPKKVNPHRNMGKKFISKRPYKHIKEHQ